MNVRSAIFFLQRATVFGLKLGYLLIAISALPAIADTVYTYTGNPYTLFEGLSCPPVCSITATLEFATPLADNLGSNFLLAAVTPVSFSITDGSNKITPANQTFSDFAVETDSSGNIEAWEFHAAYMKGGTEIELTTRDHRTNQIQDETFFFSGPYALNSDDAGTWCSRSSVPEPSSIFLILIAFATLYALFRRRELGRRKASDERTPDFKLFV